MAYRQEDFELMEWTSENPMANIADSDNKMDWSSEKSLMTICLQCGLHWNYGSNILHGAHCVSQHACQVTTENLQNLVHCISVFTNAAAEISSGPLSSRIITSSPIRPAIESPPQNFSHNFSPIPSRSVQNMINLHQSLLQIQRQLVEIKIAQKFD